jgi:hypothetical protein
VGQAVGHLLCECKALCLNPSPERKKEGRKEEGRKEGRRKKKERKKNTI